MADFAGEAVFLRARNLLAIQGWPTGEPLSRTLRRRDQSPAAHHPKGGVDVGYRAWSGGASPLLLTGTGIGASARFIAFAPPSYTAVENLSVFDPNFIGGIEVG